ncbi:MAG: transposase [Gammaproteobacteria bacterium]|nr:transposase [Gammaproteobacteria bacterium]
MKKKRRIRPPKVEFEFTDLDLTAFGGASVLAQTARRFGLFELLDAAVSVKVRNRGASDTETLWAIIASLARGHGALTDLDALRADHVASTVLGLRKVPEARRAGEWLGRMRAGDVKGLWQAAVAFAARVAPAIIDHEVRTKGYVPLFIDATGIEVDGRLFQWARQDYHGNRGYWLHGTFLGGLWSAGQLQPGGGRVTLNWRKLLDWTAGMVPAGTPVWLRADNAYYQGALVGECAARGWDYSISVTHDGWRKPVLEQLEGLPDAAWTDLGMEEEAIFASHRPGRWEREQHYVVVRRRMRGGQLLLVPHHTVILVSRDDLPLDELVRRHRGKQGQENAFKGPLIDMDLHHPPCRSYRANQAFYALGQIAQVLLRAVQYTALPKSARRHGIRPVIRYVVRTAAHMVRTGRRVVMRFAKTNCRLDWLYAAMVHLEARAPPRATSA